MNLTAIDFFGKVVWTGGTDDERAARLRAYEATGMEPDESCQQLSKSLCGKGNATLKELLNAVEQLKRRAEPENRVLTLEELDEMACKDDWEFAWLEYQSIPDVLMQVCPHNVDEISVWFAATQCENDIFYAANDYNKTWRCWLRKPTAEEMSAVKWEE